MKDNIIKIHFKNANTMEGTPVTQWDTGQVIEFVDNFPTGTQVQFRQGNTTINRIIMNKAVQIPNEILTRDDTIVAWIQVIGHNNSTTVKTLMIPVRKRLKPADYVTPEDEPTFIEQVQQMINDIRQTAESVRQDADNGVFDGTDGISPAITIQAVDGGHKVVIQDAEGIKEFIVMDGNTADVEGIVTSHIQAYDQNLQQQVSRLLDELNDQIEDLDNSKMERYVIRLVKNSDGTYKMTALSGETLSFNDVREVTRRLNEYVVVLYGNSKLRPQYVSDNEMMFVGLDRSTESKVLRIIFTPTRLNYETFKLTEWSEFNEVVTQQSQQIVEQAKQGACIVHNDGSLSLFSKGSEVVNLLEVEAYNYIYNLIAQGSVVTVGDLDVNGFGFLDGLESENQDYTQALKWINDKNIWYLKTDNSFIRVDKPQIGNVKINGVETTDNNIPLGQGGVLGVTTVLSTDPRTGIRASSMDNYNNVLILNPASNSRIDSRSGNMAITPENLEYAVTSVVDIEEGTQEQVTFVEGSDLEHYVKDTDYATPAKGGVIKINSNYGSIMDNGYLRPTVNDYDVYITKDDKSFISKGTLENIKENLVKSVVDKKWVLKGVINTENKDSRCDVDFDGCTEFYIKGKLSTTSSVSLIASDNVGTFYLVYNLTNTNDKLFLCHWKDLNGMIENISAKSESSLSSRGVSTQYTSAYSIIDSSVNAIKYISVSNYASKITSCDIEIYAR